jgi:hypothetical protein
MTMKTVMVQMADKQWTMEAMHLASALARNTGSKLLLLHLSLANNPGLLGWGIPAPTASEHCLIREFASVAEDYGVAFSVQPMQFVSLNEALVQVVELCKVQVLFAHIPPSNIPFWRQFRLWNLKRQLGNCRLYTLDEEQPICIEESIPDTVHHLETT